MKNFSPPSRPVEILLDTDMATDCDDAGAMAVLHTLARIGEVRIRAIAQTLAGDTMRYGHSPFSRGDAPSATSVYRRALAAIGDGQAVIASIGHLNNLHALLFSPPDEHSPLPGVELVLKKVAHLIVMGGDYPEGMEHNFCALGSNTVTAGTIEHWPTPILFSGFTLGLALKTGPGLLALPETHPVRRAYAMHPAHPLQNGRPSWDQTAVLAAARGPEAFWALGPAGINRIGADGANIWQFDPLGPHTYLVKKIAPIKAIAVIEALMIGNAEA